MAKKKSEKARNKAKKTKVESSIETEFSSNQREETVQTDVDITEQDEQIDLKALRKKVKKQSAKEKTLYFEDEHRKLTVWVKNEAFEILQVLAANKKGEKTRIVTEALMQYAENYMKK